MDPYVGNPVQPKNTLRDYFQITAPMSTSLVRLESLREQRFYWHLKLLFPQCKAEYIEKRIPDNQTLCEILKKYIDPTESDPTIRQRLKQYVTSPSDVKVFMEAEKTKPGEKRYYMLDVNRSLLENLQKKTIMEFPTLHVALKDFTEYTVLADQGDNQAAGVS